MHGNTIVCPTHLVEDIMRLHHDSPFAGHKAAEPTLNSIRKRYYWLLMPTMVEKYCRSCKECQTLLTIN